MMSVRNKTVKLKIWICVLLMFEGIEKYILNICLEYVYFISLFNF